LDPGFQHDREKAAHSQTETRRTPARLDGWVNAARTACLADRPGLPRRAIVLVRGDRSRQKILRIDGITLDEVKSRLGA
jgi:uncharacterized protein YggU (UPF0235/DUF167 family)